MKNANCLLLSLIAASLFLSFFSGCVVHEHDHDHDRDHPVVVVPDHDHDHWDHDHDHDEHFEH